MASWYFRDANGLVLVYDITHIRSFERVSGWVDNVRKSAPADVKIFLVGDKIFQLFQLFQLLLLTYVSTV